MRYDVVFCCCCCYCWWRWRCCRTKVAIDFRCKSLSEKFFFFIRLVPFVPIVQYGFDNGVCTVLQPPLFISNRWPKVSFEQQISAKYWRMNGRIPEWQSIQAGHLIKFIFYLWFGCLFFFLVCARIPMNNNIWWVPYGGKRVSMFGNKVRADLSKWIFSCAAHWIREKVFHFEHYLIFDQ